MFRCSLHREVRGQWNCVPGDVAHLWHGEMTRRKHRQRYADFAQFEFLGYYLEGKNPWFNPAPFHTPSQSKEIFTSSFDYCYESVPGGVWNTILHPQCCGRDFKVNWLESVMQYTVAKPGIWFTTMREVARNYVND